MRVLLVNHSARPFNGGANRVVVETCQFLEQAGHEVLLVYFDEGPVSVRCAVHSLPNGGRPGELKALIGAWKPDVIQVHSLRGDTMPQELTSAPAAIFLHDQTWFCASGDRMKRNLSPCHRPHGLSCLFWNYAQGCGRKSPLGNLLFWRRTQYLQQVYQQPLIRLQVASSFMREGLLENHHDPARIDLVPLYAPVPKTSGIQQEPGLLFLPSRLVPPKGVQIALQAAAKLRDRNWRLVIAGEGWHRSTLENLANSLGIQDRTQFIGEVAPDDVATWYDRSELVLFPVLRLEPFGLVGVEALSHGRALVGFGGGGADEWLRHGESAIRVTERTPEAFASAIDSLLADRARIQRLAEGARHHYPRFHPDAYLARLLASFERAIEDFGGRRR